MPEAPKDYRYLESHEWHKQEPDGTISLGITHFAADELTDITYVSLPKIGDKVTANGRWGEIESVKAVSDLYSPVNGEVVESHAELADNLDVLKTDPYGKGWLVKVKVSDDQGLGDLLSYSAYQKQCAEEQH